MQALHLIRHCQSTGQQQAKTLTARLKTVQPDAWFSSFYLTHTYEGPDDMPAHIKAAMQPVRRSIPVQNGALALRGDGDGSV